MSAWRVVPSVRVTLTESGVVGDRVDPGAGDQRDPVAGGHPTDDPAEERTQRALVGDVEGFDDGDVEAAVVRGRRDLGADETGPDDEQAAGRLEGGAQR